MYPMDGVRELVCRAALLLMGITCHGAFAQTLTGESMTATLGSRVPTVSSPPVLEVAVPVCHFFEVMELDTDPETGVVSITIYPYNHGFTCTPALVGEVEIAGLGEIGVYQLDVYELLSTFTDETRLLGSLELAIAHDGPLHRVETPAADSVQSGIGLVRGWACQAETVEVQFNDQSRQSVAYGSSRPDTVGVCGDEDNGYGMAFAWGLLGAGNHTMRTFIDGEEVSVVEFEVAGLEDPFARGLSGAYELEDFPAPGQSVTVRWSESAQNFIIVDVSN